MDVVNRGPLIASQWHPPPLCKFHAGPKANRRIALPPLGESGAVADGRFTLRGMIWPFSSVSFGMEVRHSSFAITRSLHSSPRSFTRLDWLLAICRPQTLSLTSRINPCACWLPACALPMNTKQGRGQIERLQAFSEQQGAGLPTILRLSL
ncbi:hypothetical protein K437DRAFT_176648 [Tilletiaria anomala UBC 951]|uniref:Uncharacterized protein n=1 Tax=Tilletiaria anomala (strain ATCC 24038 / CBS 436.72 / UBC 951) TaxID=1037660 RepID=A0A066VRK7_TILAU|nr:uncharacterized protein K437DRAFT_176648 [Tilletiaria anomala UBC 951]KDN41424.1 hypothetical protein K437DRAFT_176648 [Tilletiaria anomala UBC 951]